MKKAKIPTSSKKLKLLLRAMIKLPKLYRDENSLGAELDSENLLEFSKIMHVFNMLF